MLDEIHTLLDTPEHGRDAPSLEALEHTLTSGYAQALQLEAEHWRLERRVGEITARIANGSSARAEAGELATLTERMSTAEEDLGTLRRALRRLRDRASAIRAA